MPRSPYDAIIVGAGAAGLMAALRSAAKGARVALLDTSDGTHSNMAASGGMFAGAGTRFQAAAGVTDSAARWSEDILRKTAGAVDPIMLDAITARSADAVHFLADHVGLDLHLCVGVPFPGHSAPRLHATTAQDGSQLATLLLAAARRTEAIHLFEQTEATGLLVEAGVVTGVKATGNRDLTAPLTLLASGGFAANPAMVARHAPDVAAAVNIGSGPNDGRALQWGAACGGELLFMDSYQGQGHVTADGLGRLGAGVTSIGGIVLNANGQRFADESMGPSEFGACVLAQPGGWAVEVFDAAMHATMLRIGSYRDAVARGCVIEAPTIEALAATFALPAAALTRTLTDYETAIRTNQPDPYGRTIARTGLTPPYRAARITGALAHTQGGLRVDARARVVRADGSVVRGLLAAGGAAAGLSGHGAAGYIPGNGLGQAFALGLIAGETIATRTIATRTIAARPIPAGR